MLGPRRRRGVLSFAAVAAWAMLPGSVALGATAPSVGSIVGDPSVLTAPVPAPSVTTLTQAARPCAHTRTRPSRLRRAVARAALLCAVNRARAIRGLAPFTGERHLGSAALSHARDMVRRRYFAHQRAGGPSFSTRLRRAGWQGRSAGEAIAWGCGRLANAAAAVRAWLNSPPHRAILLASGFHRAGIGVAARAPVSCAPGATWVLDAGG